MSSVTSKSSGTSGQDDQVRQARDEYRKKEAELVKKHNKQMKALSDKYSQDLQKLSSQHTTNLDDTRNKSQEALTQRDLRYQKEMAEMRKMHSKQMAKLMQDNANQVAAERNSAKFQLKQADIAKKDRVDNLNVKYDHQMAQALEDYAQQLDDIKTKSREESAEQKERLGKAHQKEKDAIIGERNETVSDLRRDFRKLRMSSSERLRNQEIRHMRDKARMTEQHMNSMQREDEIHGAIQESSREQFQENLREVREKLALAREKDLQAQNEITGDFKSSVEDRIDSQVRGLEDKLERAKQANLNETYKTKIDAKRNISNVRKDYQTKFDYLERDRKETLNQANEINAENIRKITAQKDNQMSEATKHMRQRMEMENFRNREALDRTKHDFELRSQFQTENANRRVEQMHAGNIKQQQNLREAYVDNIQVQKEAFDSEKKDLLVAFNKDKSEAITRLKGEFQKQEVDHQRRLQDTTAKYEARISKMNDDAIREQRLRENREKTIIKELQRKNEMEKEHLRIKYEEQNKQTQAAHERELKDLQRRNQEKLDEVLNTMKKQRS